VVPCAPPKTRTLDSYHKDCSNKQTNNSWKSGLTSSSIPVLISVCLCVCVVCGFWVLSFDALGMQQCLCGW
jgi:hypothetical protein